MTNQEESNAPANPSEQPNPSWVARTVQRIKRYLQDRRTKQEKENPQDRAARSTARATWAIAVLTAVTICVGVSQYIIFGRQLDVMENDKRPWIKADVSIPAYVLTTEWEGSRGINFPLKFLLRNFGQVPAVNVRIYQTVAVHPGNILREQLSAPQKEICDSASSKSDKNPIGGIAIFPNETEVIETGNGLSGGGLYKDGKPVLFAVLGCVDYTYGDGRHGQTGFRFMLGKDVGGMVSGVPYVEGLPLQSNVITEDDIKNGADPVKGAKIPIEELYFKPADSGNYAK